MGTQIPPEKRPQPHPIFGPCLLWPNGSMDEDVTWYGSRPRPRPHCVRRAPSSPQKGHSTPLFSAYVYCGHGRPSQLLLSSCNLPHLYLAPPLWVTPFELSETWAIGYRDYGSCSQHGSRSHDQLQVAQLPQRDRASP